MFLGNFCSSPRKMCCLSKHENPASSSPQGSVLLFSFAGTKRRRKKSCSQVHLHTKYQPLWAAQRQKHLCKQDRQVDFLCIGGNRRIKIPDTLISSAWFYDPKPKPVLLPNSHHVIPFQKYFTPATALKYHSNTFWKMYLIFFFFFPENMGSYWI